LGGQQYVVVAAITQPDDNGALARQSAILQPAALGLIVIATALIYGVDRRHGGQAR
jgi:hypothetical protein